MAKDACRMCPDCEGVDPYMPFRGNGKCNKCNGTGKYQSVVHVPTILISLGTYVPDDTCNDCNGQKQCQTCGGSGYEYYNHDTDNALDNEGEKYSYSSGSHGNYTGSYNRGGYSDASNNGSDFFSHIFALIGCFVIVFLGYKGCNHFSTNRNSNNTLYNNNSLNKNSRLPVKQESENIINRDKIIILGDPVKITGRIITYNDGGEYVRVLIKDDNFKETVLIVDKSECNYNENDIHTNNSLCIIANKADFKGEDVFAPSKIELYGGQNKNNTNLNGLSKITYYAENQDNNDCKAKCRFVNKTSKDVIVLINRYTILSIAKNDKKELLVSSFGFLNFRMTVPDNIHFNYNDYENNFYGAVPITDCALTIVELNDDLWGINPI